MQQPRSNNSNPAEKDEVKTWLENMVARSDADLADHFNTTILQAGTEVMAQLIWPEPPAEQPTLQRHFQRNRARDARLLESKTREFQQDPGQRQEFARSFRQILASAARFSSPELIESVAELEEQAEQLSNQTGPARRAARELLNWCSPEDRMYADLEILAEVLRLEETEHNYRELAYAALLLNLVQERAQGNRN